MIEFFVYTRDDSPVDIAALRQTMHEARWISHVARGWLDSNGFDLISEGELQEDDCTIVYRNDNLLATEFESALSKRDRQKLDTWIYDGSLGYAMWAANRPFRFAKHAEFESLDDAREQMGDDYADHLAKTRCMYVVTNCPDIESTLTIMGAVALLKGGLVEDPQMGTCAAGPKNAQELSRFSDEWPEE